MGGWFGILQVFFPFVSFPKAFYGVLIELGFFFGREKKTLSGERQAWKKAKALVSQRASDRTRQRGRENVEKDFTEADENANRLFDFEESELYSSY